MVKTRIWEKIRALTGCYKPWTEYEWKGNNTAQGKGVFIKEYICIYESVTAFGSCGAHWWRKTLGNLTHIRGGKVANLPRGQRRPAASIFEHHFALSLKTWTRSNASKRLYLGTKHSQVQTLDIEQPLRKEWDYIHRLQRVLTNIHCIFSIWLVEPKKDYFESRRVLNLWPITAANKTAKLWGEKDSR
jgi:hypothetical protein